MKCYRMNRKMISSILLSLFLTACFAGSAFAIPATFFGEDLGLGETTPLPFWPLAANAESAFLGNLIGSIGTETFESPADGTVAPLPVTFTGSGVVATLFGDGFVANVTPGTTNGVGRYAISGSQYWDSSSDFSIQFSEPVAAFGFYGVDIGDFNGQVTLTLESGGTVDLVIPNTTNGLGGSVIFFGFVDTEQSYTAITLGNTAPGVDVFGFDNMTIATGAEVLVGACCLEAFQCMVVSSGECSQVGNGVDDSFYLGDGTNCEGTCDNVVAIEESSWGSLKSLYR